MGFTMSTSPWRGASSDLNVAVRAGAVYFAIVFSIAFLLGAIRVLLVAPRLGETVAVMLEAPLILAISWAASRSCVRLFEVREETAPRLLMGAVAFAILMSAELGVSVLIFGRSVADFVAGYLSIPGAIGLAAQLAFGVVPAIQGQRELRRSAGVAAATMVD
jgi:hypothetical protein